MLQNKLNLLGYIGANGRALSVDGLFGENTLYAVKNFQQKNGLTVDGLVGDKTWEKLQLIFDVAYNENYGPEEYYDHSNDSVEVVPAWQQVGATAVLLAPAVKAGLAAIASLGVGLIPAAPTIGQISQETQNHIMHTKHAWDRVVSDPNNWGQIHDVVMNVVKNGTESAYGSALQKTMQIKNELVVVTYKIVDGVIRISDGWVKTR